MKLKNALTENRFGQFDVTDMRQIIPKYQKELQEFLDANNAGKIYGIASGGLSEGKLLIIGQRAIITVDMNKMEAIRVTLIVK